MFLKRNKQFKNYIVIGSFCSVPSFKQIIALNSFFSERSVVHLENIKNYITKSFFSVSNVIFLNQWCLIDLRNRKYELKLGQNHKFGVIRQFESG